MVDRRNHLEHDDGLMFAPRRNLATVPIPVLPKTVLVLDCSGSDESFAEVCKILRAEAILNPPEPNAAVTAAANQYLAEINSRPWLNMREFAEHCRSFYEKSK